MKKQRKKEWAKASWHALREHCRQDGFLRTAMQAVSVAVFLATHRPTGKLSLYLRKRRACRKCPLFDSELKTCGSTKVREALDNQVLGCLCYIPVKAAYDSLNSNSFCWIDLVVGPDDAPGLGWHNAIFRSSPSKTR